MLGHVATAKAKGKPSAHLRAVGILASIGHGQKARFGMLIMKILILKSSINTHIQETRFRSRLPTVKFLPVNGPSASSVSSGEVPPLQHELHIA